MKFNCGLSRHEKFVAQQKWHRWFAWRPVRVGSRDCRWLETVERIKIYHNCGMDYFTSWEYRAIKNEP